MNREKKLIHRTRLAILVAVAMMIGTAGTARPDEVAEGRRLFLQYCASCHGIKGEGNGPIAPQLTTPPANLRLLSQRYGNPLPEDQIARFIDGRAEVKAHGPRDMPVWGRRFQQESGDEAKVKGRIRKLVAYLQSIQSGTRTAMLP